MRLITRVLYTRPYTIRTLLPNDRIICVRWLAESFVSVVHGHHVYKSVWIPLLGKRLSVRPKSGNNHDKHAVSVVKHGGIVSMVPRQLSQTVWHFLLHGGQVLGTCA